MERSIPTIEGLEPRVLLSGSPILVDTFLDVVDAGDNQTSLREAITLAAAPGDDVIQLQAGWYGLNKQLTINDTSGSLSILGIGGLATLDAQGSNYRVMKINAGSNVQLTQLGITGGYSEDGNGGGIYTEGNLSLESCEVFGNHEASPTDGRGGGIYVQSSTLNLTNSTVSGNTVDHGSGGGVNVWWGELNLIHSTLTGNSAEWPGGGIFARGGTLHLTDTTLSENSTNYGAGIYASFSSTLDITNSTLAGNVATYDGGGIHVSSDSTMNLTNSTLAGNTASRGGGIFIDDTSTATVTNVTISGNTGMSEGGGIYNEGSLNLDNTILAGNYTEGGPGDLLNNSLVESRLGGGPTNNLIESYIGPDIQNGVDGNIVGQPAMLGALSDSGGPTQTMPPSPYSPAIDAGNDAALMGWTTQQAASGGYAGEWSSLVLDVDGNAHIATYQSGDAVLYSNSTGSWVQETIEGYGYGDGEQGRLSEIIMDAAGNLHATYRHENDEGDIRYATNASGTWQAETVSTEGKFSSPAVDSEGNVHVAYDTAASTTSSLWLANNAAGSWQSSEIDSDGYVRCPSLAIDDADHMHIAYFDVDGGVLKYTTDASGAWVTTVVDTGLTVATYSHLSLVLDQDGYVHIAYHNDDGKTVHYATNRSGSWSTTIIDDAGVAGAEVDLAVDANGAAHVCIGRDDKTGLRYATNRSGAWKVYEFASDRAGQGYRPTIAVDNEGRAHIAYAYAESSLHYGVISWEANSDQRGEEFPRFVDTVDIGAVEAEVMYPDGYGVIDGEVWNDLNGDGVRVAGEEGLDGVTVELYTDDGDGLFNPASDERYGSVTTADGGYYSFWEIDAPVEYFIRVLTPAEYVFSPQGQDSDVDALTGASDLLSLQPESSLTRDAGLVLLQPEIDVTYDEVGERHDVNFGDVVTNEAQTFYIQIRNTGDAPLIISDLAGLDAPFSYQLVDSSDAMDWAIESGGWREVELSFLPTDGGAFADTLSIYSDDADEYQYDLQLTGMGLIPPTVTATLPQAGEGYDHGDPNGEEPGQITVEFSRPMDPAALADPLNYDLRRDSNGDGDFTDETPFAVNVITADGMTAYLDIGGDLPTGNYQLALNGQVGGLLDTNGVLLDGDADGQIGGNWVGTFTMVPRPEIDVELLEQNDVHSHLLPRIDLGTTTEEWFTIRNEGDATLELGSIEFGGDSPFTVTLPSTTILPGDTLQIQVLYTPTEQGRDIDTLYISSNDADEPVYELTVTGEAVLPQGTGYYEVWGGNTDYRPDVMWWQSYHNIDQLDYTYLGGSLDAGSVTEFLGSAEYEYYIIATRARVQVDAVQGSDGLYGYSVGDGNTRNWENVSADDNQYATIGYQGNSDAFCGFLIIQNPGEWDGMTVYTGNIDLPLHVSIEQNAITDGTGAAYLFEHYVDVCDQRWSTSMRFQAPSGEWYDMWWDADEYDNGWEYWDESFADIPDMENEFGEGWYKIEALGSPFGTTTTVVWFGDQNGVSPLAWPTQIPEITNQAYVPTTATLEWNAVTDENVTAIHSYVDDAFDTTWARFWSDRSATSFGSANLATATNYEWALDFVNHHDGITLDEITVDEITYDGGYGYYVERSLESSVMFHTAGEPSNVEPNLVMGEAFYAPGVYRPGEAIDMDFLVGNLGDGNAVLVSEGGLVELFYDEVRLSFDPFWSDDDVVIYRRPDDGWLGQEAEDTRNELAPPENRFRGLPTIPLDVERGNYYVLAGIDVHDQVAESDESDNLWVSDTPNVSVETLVGVAQPKHLLSVGVANPGVNFRGDVAAQRVSEAFDGMTGLVTNLLLRYNIDQPGNQDHLLDTLAWFESRVLPGDQFIFYVASQACYDLEGNEIAVDAQFDTTRGRWNRTRTTTGDEYLYLSSVDGESNWLADDKLALQFFNSTWAAANKVFILDTPYAGGFIGRENPEDESQWDLALLRFDPDEELAENQTERTQWASGTIEVIAAAGEAQFAFMTPEKSVGWAGVNRMGTHMIAPILAQADPEHDVLDIDQLFWQTKEENSVYCNDVGILFANADGNPEQGEEEDDSGGTVLDSAGGAHVQLGADVKLVRYVDPDGSTVTLRLSLGTADLTFLGANFRQTFSRGVVTIQADEGAMLGAIRLIDTTDNDALIISVRGGDGYADLGGIIGHNSLGQLVATRVNLVGEGIYLEGNASIGLTRLHNIRNGADVIMDGAGPNQGVQFIAATVDDGTDMYFGGAVRLLYLNRWAGGSLEADYVQVLRVRKDMGADVTLTGANNQGQSILMAYVFGDVTGGAWDVAGAVRNWYVRGSVYGADLQLNDTITNLYVRGNLIDSAVHLADAKMIRVAGQMVNSRATSQGDIRTMIVGAMRNSTVFAGVQAEYDLNEDGVLDLPDRSDLLPDAGRITHFQVRGMRGVDNAFVNSNLAAGSFGSVRLQMSTLSNPFGLDGAPQPFGLTMGTDGVDRLQLVLNRKSYFWQQHTWTRNLDPQDLAVIDTA